MHTLDRIPQLCIMLSRRWRGSSPQRMMRRSLRWHVEWRFGVSAAHTAPSAGLALPHFVWGRRSQKQGWDEGIAAYRFVPKLQGIVCSSSSWWIYRCNGQSQQGNPLQAARLCTSVGIPLALAMMCNIGFSDDTSALFKQWPVVISR